ncbi:phosphate ABC transporter permease subunit PstC [Clostridium tepidum]|uniref:Phosphate transport system permease protein n=1 Tax=Clostridium tepidum TaxID=1962263 RepID=A0ABX3L5R2_9CLOT|nr:phosphate ABC transporter permease subunit PstC [Clostridium tepidum]MCR1935181.1 phosphate ABC transporter permease subunit PstC [Clostridium tepidum]OOO63097.1 phosphate ABC transporter permease subunit PstC [Clostridium tepidum]
MHKFIDRVFYYIIRFFTFLSIVILSLILIFIFKESLGIFKHISFIDFITKSIWEPLGETPNLSILSFILSTFYVTFLAVMFALPIAIGTSIFLANIASKRLRNILKPIIDMLSGIPSVIYGFIGLSVVVKFFERKLHVSSGECILSAAIVLSIMILPFIISNCTDTMIKIYDKYFIYSKSLGISKWYMMNNLIIPASKKAILASVILAVGRGMGETMAVMMVIGNSPLMPKLLGKGETISSLIALEMGSAQVGSMHYSGLFASGFILMIMLLIINSIFYVLRENIEG